MSQRRANPANGVFSLGFTSCLATYRCGCVSGALTEYLCVHACVCVSLHSQVTALQGAAWACDVEEKAATH